MLPRSRPFRFALWLALAAIVLQLAGFASGVAHAAKADVPWANDLCITSGMADPDAPGGAPGGQASGHCPLCAGPGSVGPSPALIVLLFALPAGAEPPPLPSHETPSAQAPLRAPAAPRAPPLA